MVVVVLKQKNCKNALCKPNPSIGKKTFVVHTARAPVVEFDPDAGAVYVRFKRASDKFEQLFR
jgi:hypothetical protein